MSFSVRSESEDRVASCTMMSYLNGSKGDMEPVQGSKSFFFFFEDGNMKKGYVQVFSLFLFSPHVKNSFTTKSSLAPQPSVMPQDLTP